MAPTWIRRSGSVDVLGSISMQQPEKFRTNTAAAAADLYTTIPSLFGNVGLIFVKGDLKEVGEVTNIYQDASVAKEKQSEDDEYDSSEELVREFGWMPLPYEVYYKDGVAYVDCPYFEVEGLI